MKARTDNSDLRLGFMAPSRIKASALLHVLAFIRPVSFTGSSNSLICCPSEASGREDLDIPLLVQASAASSVAFS
jgi:hypothetical protein